MTNGNQQNQTINDLGDFILRLGIALLFIWGGVEKFFKDFLGGVGLDAMVDLFSGSAIGFLGNSILLVITIVLAITEIIAGILILINKKTAIAYSLLGIIMIGAMLLVHIPSGNWFLSMIHLCLVTTLIGLSIKTYAQKGLK